MRGRVGGQGPRARGNTLVELIVVLAILGVLAGVAGLSFRTAVPPAVASEVDARIADARREAIRTGRSVTVLVVKDGEPLAATAHPDGWVIADTLLGVEPSSDKPLPWNDTAAAA